MIEMIDLHAHILPRLDDGAESLEESIEMCRISYKDGVRTIVATPHILPGVYKNNRPTILTKTQELNEAIKEFGVGSSPACTKRFGEGREFRVQDSGVSTHSSIRIETETLNNPSTHQPNHALTY